MKQALVTGGAGFIGSELTKLLLEKKVNVTVLDNLSFGQKSHLWNGVRFIRGDLRSPASLRKALDRKYDIVFHLAALHFIPYCNEHPDEALSVNVDGTFRLLQALRAKPPKRLFFASTAAVYGPASEPHRESDVPNPLDIYGISKLSGEHLVREYSDDTDVHCAVGRLFNAYGPRETNPHLIPAIVEQVRRGKTTIQLGNIKPFRDYIHTSDMARAIYLLATKPSARFVTANIGSGKEFSVEQVVNVFSKVIGKKLKIQSKANLKRKVERMHLRPSLLQIRKLTGFRCEMNFAEGIRQLVL